MTESQELVNTEKRLKGSIPNSVKNILFISSVFVILTFSIFGITRYYSIKNDNKTKLNIKIPQTITQSNDKKLFEKTVLDEEAAKKVKRSAELNKDAQTTVVNQLSETSTADIKFNKSIVIVWEKCNEARTQTTKIFKTLNYLNTVILYFDPSINGIILRTVYQNLDEDSKILSLPNFTGEILYFMFHETNKIHIYYDCPSISKVRLHMELPDSENLDSLQLFKNSKSFFDLNKASERYRCRTVLTVIPGTVLHYDDHFEVAGNHLLFSFNIGEDLYSVSYEKHDSVNSIFIVANDKRDIVGLSKNIIDSGLYLIFNEYGIEFYVDCPVDQVPVGNWDTELFEFGLKVETSKAHSIGQSATDELLEAYCSTQFISDSIEENPSYCMNNEDVKSYIYSLDQANQVYTTFLPTQQVVKQIELFETITSENYLNFGNLIENEPRIMIASRNFAKNQFFNKAIYDYAHGFTDGQFNYWIGLEYLNKITDEGDYKLIVEAETLNDFLYVEEYAYFKVDNVKNKYKLTVDGLIMSYDKNGFFQKLNGLQFSTKNYGNTTLSKKRLGAFWLTKDQTFCLTCEDGRDSKGTFTFINLNKANKIKSYSLRMFLVPIDKNQTMPMKS